MSLSSKRSLAGFLFVLPWIIGFLGLFARPLISSLYFTFNKVTISNAGIQYQPVGAESYVRAIFSDMYFIRYLVAQVSGLLKNVVVIIAFSLLMAVIISGRFRGRTVVRTIFFLPVIAGSGIVLSIMKNDALSNSILTGARSSMMFQTAGIDSILLNMGLRSDIVTTFMGIINGMFSMSWKSGLQILLFLTALLTISTSLYESARIEGATRWEMFWKITFPMISPIIVLNVVYTIIDDFTDYNNQVMQYIQGFAKMLDLHFSATLSWIYFLVIMVVVGLGYWIINKWVVYTVE